MKTSNKILLAAVAVLLALFLTFVLVMGFTTRELLRRRGTTVYSPPTVLELQSPLRAAGPHSAGLTA